MFSHLTRLLLSLVLAALCLPSHAKPYPPGPLLAEHISFRFVIYYPAKPRTDQMAFLKQTLATTPDLELVKQIPSTPTRKTVFADLARGSAPSLALLKHFSRGVSPEQGKALQGERDALELVFAHPGKQANPALHAAYVITERIARTEGAFIWDEETRELFSADEWKKARLATWTDGIPDASETTTIHAYKNGTLLRAITLGMAKLGLPDLVIDDYPSSSGRSVGTLLGLLSQAIVEGMQVGKNGDVDLAAGTLRHNDVRNMHLRYVKENAKPVTLLRLLQGKRDEGDPENRLAAVVFDRYPGPDRFARQEAALSAAFGSTDMIKYVKHDEAVRAESKRARARLIAMEGEFNKGLPPGTFIQVKAPFKTPDGGNEWMWVEIVTWSGNRIQGLLKNDPYNVPSLRAGQRVDIDVDQVFDYIRYSRDGAVEGNTTGKLIEQMRSLR